MDLSSITDEQLKNEFATRFVKLAREHEAMKMTLTKIAAPESYDMKRTIWNDIAAQCLKVTFEDEFFKYLAELEAKGLPLSKVDQSALNVINIAKEKVKK